MLRTDLDAAELSERLLQFLRLKLVEGTDAFILESVFANTVFDTLRLPFSRVNEVRVMTFLEDFCVRALERMESVGNEEDDSRLARASETVQAALARLRVQERAALRASLARVQAELRTLVDVRLSVL